MMVRKENSYTSIIPFLHFGHNKLLFC